LTIEREKAMLNKLIVYIWNLITSVDFLINLIWSEKLD
jgi:hypothetical protein